MALTVSADREATAFYDALTRQAQEPAAPVRQRRGPDRRNELIGAYSGDTNLYGRNGRGGFHGGQFDRLSESWNPGNVGPNMAQRMGGMVLRQRARDLVLNNPYAFSAVDGYVANVIQVGITPKPGFDDRDARKRWIAAFEKWGGITAQSTRECDITGHDTYYDLQALWLTEVIVGGGCLVHYVEMPRKGRSIPLAMEMIPEERFYDFQEWSGPNTKTANRVINGVEIDSATGAAVAYWVRVGDMDTDPTGESFEPVRIERSQCEYAYFKRRSGQYRGYTLLASAVIWLHAIGYYTDNEMYASNAKSAYAYMIQTNLNADSGFSWNVLEDNICEQGTVDYYGNPVTNHQTGMIFRGAPGDTIQAVGPNVPGSDSGAWIEMILRSISIGCGISYEELCRDYSKGNFSSTRASGNSDRIRYRRMWNFCDRRLNNPTWSRFAAASVRAGTDGFPSAQEFISNQDDLLRVRWEGPSWESVNPSDDALADDIRLKNGTKTRAQCINGDIDEHFDELEREAETMREKSLHFESADVDPNEVSTDGKLEKQSKGDK